jgi:outer membrane lipoprotein-sorting protein
MRWEVTGPVKMVVVMDGRTMTSYYPDRKEAFRRGLRDDMATQAATEFLAAGMSASFGELEKRFRLELLREDDGVVVRLSPRSRWLARGLSSIDIHHGSRDAVPTRIVVAGTRGDRTETRLRDVTVNPTFAEDPFVLDLGPDVRITEVGRPAAGGDDGA